jgi:hypothetical protein
MEGSYKRAAELAAGLFNPSNLTSNALSADSELQTTTTTEGN